MPSMAETEGIVGGGCKGVEKELNLYRTADKRNLARETRGTLRFETHLILDTRIPEG